MLIVTFHCESYAKFLVLQNISWQIFKKNPCKLRPINGIRGMGKVHFELIETLLNYKIILQKYKKNNLGSQKLENMLVVPFCRKFSTNFVIHGKFYNKCCKFWPNNGKNSYHRFENVTSTPHPN